MSAQHTPGPSKAERNAYFAEWERNIAKATSHEAQWCEKCGVDVYVNGRCCAYGCGHVKGAAIAKATGAA